MSGDPFSLTQHRIVLIDVDGCTKVLGETYHLKDAGEMYRALKAPYGGRGGKSVKWISRQESGWVVTAEL